ncbi:hypothetical protein J7E50_22255, partial [Pedobacter sp. ISL-68]|uniref:hypothetical protein n=1 Tax=Pedobacter sp. ISL-68 TaxID=2819165 RepID=UPI001BECEA68
RYPAATRYEEAKRKTGGKFSVSQKPCAPKYNNTQLKLIISDSSHRSKAELFIYIRIGNWRDFGSCLLTVPLCIPSPRYAVGFTLQSGL